MARLFATSTITNPSRASAATIAITANVVLLFNPNSQNGANCLKISGKRIQSVPFYGAISGLIPTNSIAISMKLLLGRVSSVYLTASIPMSISLTTPKPDTPEDHRTIVNNGKKHNPVVPARLL